MHILHFRLITADIVVTLHILLMANIVLLYYIININISDILTCYILNSHRYVQLLNSLETIVVSAIFIDECHRTREPFWSTLENTSLWLSHQRTLLYYTAVPTSAVYYTMTEPACTRGYLLR